MEELGTVPEMGIEETKGAIKAAGEAFLTWGKTTAKVTGRHFGLYYFLTCSWGSIATTFL
jgi:acyl-CoA reductase-like NAD-dependent aldehyde dehydrogenase